MSSSDKDEPFVFDPSMEVAILVKVSPYFSDDGDAFVWFRSQPLPGLGGKTARDLARAGRGREVLDYIESIDAEVLRKEE